MLMRLIRYANWYNAGDVLANKLFEIKDGSTALMIAAKSGNLEAVESLVDHSTELEVKDEVKVSIVLCPIEMNIYVHLFSSLALQH